ncbi:MAG: hypothetical protein DMF64_04755 [Acidobacteria bacterium]|nr:MAG: hypothetical protein DMF64_04755 [Acidobacteriota bacterium]
MDTNVNLAAPVGVLGLLGTGLLLLGAALVILFLLLRGRRAAAGNIFVGAVGLIVAYLFVLLIFSLASAEKVLARGAEKHFCEVDCHLAYSISDVRQTKTLGSPAHEVAAQGMFYVITVKTRFDEQTIAPWRGNGPLTPNSRVVRVYDAQGRAYDPSTAGTRALELTEGTGMPFTTPLRPGESYTTELVFDLPTDIREPRLLIHEGDPVTHLIIGHENSLLHKRTSFQLTAPASEAARAND